MLSRREFTAAMSTPSKTIEPALGRYRPTTQRATVDLPQPDSPTRAKVLPRGMSKLTPSTAFRIWRGWPSIIRLSNGLETSK